MIRSGPPCLKLALGLVVLLPLWLGVTALSGAPAPDATPQAAPSATRAPTRTPTATPTPFTLVIAPFYGPIAPTITVTPTLNPEEAFNANFPAQTGSKLSLHFVRGSPASYEFLQKARPSFVKLVDAALEWSSNLREEFPAMMQIGRVTDVEDDSLERKNPVVAANEYVARTLPYYRQYPDIDYWEGWNEWVPPDQGGLNAWKAYAEFEGERACLLESYGYHAVIGNFSAGTPEYSQMLVFLSAIRTGLKCGAILGLHEYSAPTLQYGYGQGIPHRPPFPDRGMLTLRYRFWYQDLFLPLNLPIPLVITELGIDGGIRAGRPGPSDGMGWSTFGRFWQETGLGNNPAQVYMTQLAWYDSEIRQDPYVLGAAIYQAGAYGTDSFDVDKLIPDLTSYVVGMQGK